MRKVLHYIFYDKKLQGGAKGRDHLRSKAESKQSKGLLSSFRYKEKGIIVIIVKHQVHRLLPKELLHSYGWRLLTVGWTIYQVSQTGLGEWLSGSPKILKVTII